MARKYKSTGCARIFIVLLIVAPIAFFIASYINGSSPMETLSQFFGKEEKTTTSTAIENANDDETTDLKDQIRRLEKDVDYYKIESETYKKLLDECQDARSR
jgi:sensor histidine kinase YesM